MPFIKLVIVTVVFGVVVPNATADGPPFDFREDLFYLHKEVTDSKAFRDWEKAHPLMGWEESRRADDGSQVVVLEDRAAVKFADLLAVQVKGGVFIRSKEFDRKFVAASYKVAANELKTRTFASLFDSSPAVKFSANGEAALGWEFDISGNDPKVFIFDETGTMKEIRSPFVPLIAHPCKGDDDSVSSDDLHSLSDTTFRDHAEAIIGTETDIDKKAALLAHDVSTNIRAKMTGEKFTSADYLVRQYGKGACDEKAVLVVTYLRALKVPIPARIKFLRLTVGGKEKAHACVEYLSHGVWVHLDPTRDLVDHPETYREVPIDGVMPSLVKVVDADWPSDNRSNAAVDNVPDPDGDGRLASWFDFCYFPSDQGEERDRYSR
jgi:hypothetical protein